MPSEPSPSSSSATAAAAWIGGICISSPSGGAAAIGGGTPQACVSSAATAACSPAAPLTPGAFVAVAVAPSGSGGGGGDGGKEAMAARMLAKLAASGRGTSHMPHLQRQLEQQKLATQRKAAQATGEEASLTPASLHALSQATQYGSPAPALPGTAKSRARVADVLHRLAGLGPASKSDLLLSGAVVPALVGILRMAAEDAEEAQDLGDLEAGEAGCPPAAGGARDRERGWDMRALAESLACLLKLVVTGPGRAAIAGAGGYPALESLLAASGASGAASSSASGQDISEGSRDGAAAAAAAAGGNGGAAARGRRRSGWWALDEPTLKLAQSLGKFLRSFGSSPGAASPASAPSLGPVPVPGASPMSARHLVI